MSPPGGHTSTCMQSGTVAGIGPQGNWIYIYIYMLPANITGVFYIQTIIYMAIHLQEVYEVIAGHLDNFGHQIENW